jgi:hypothetical protein
MFCLLFYTAREEINFVLDTYKGVEVVVGKNTTPLKYNAQPLFTVQV